MLFRYGLGRGPRTWNRIQLCASPFCVLRSDAHRVIHDKQKRRFTVTLDHGGQVQSAVLKYSHISDDHVHLLSTEVPEPFRGVGVAASLAQAALDFVVEEKLQASISCWYIKKYVDENPHHGYQLYIKD